MRINSTGQRSQFFYSWAAIVIEMFTGNPDSKLDALMGKLKNKELAEFLIECGSPLSTGRPDSVQKF